MRPAAVDGPNSGPIQMPLPRHAPGAQTLMDRALGHLSGRYPDMDYPASLQLRPGLMSAYRRGVVADSNDRTGLVRWHETGSLRALDEMGRTGVYQGLDERRALQTLIHEINHQVGPQYAYHSRDRFLEEGLSETVARDQSEDFARTLKYRPPGGRVTRFEDGSVRVNATADFDFEADSYPEETAEVDRLAFYSAARMIPRWAGRTDPGDSPQADAWRRAMLQANEAKRRARARALNTALARQRQAPGYAGQVSRQVASVATATSQRVARSAAAPVAQRTAPAARTAAPRPATRKTTPSVRELLW